MENGKIENVKKEQMSGGEMNCEEKDNGTRNRLKKRDAWKKSLENNGEDQGGRALWKGGKNT